MSHPEYIATPADYQFDLLDLGIYLNSGDRNGCFYLVVSYLMDPEVLVSGGINELKNRATFLKQQLTGKSHLQKFARVNEYAEQPIVQEYAEQFSRRIIIHNVQTTIEGYIVDNQAIYSVSPSRSRSVLPPIRVGLGNYHYYALIEKPHWSESPLAHFSTDVSEQFTSSSQKIGASDLVSIFGALTL
jgi:hypothetical protein